MSVLNSNDNVKPVKGLLKGLRYISQIFDDDEKEPEMQIGNPTDVKHVAHIGWDGNTDGPPTWMNGFQEQPGSPGGKKPSKERPKSSRRQSAAARNESDNKQNKKVSRQTKKENHNHSERAKSTGTSTSNSCNKDEVDQVGINEVDAAPTRKGQRKKSKESSVVQCPKSKSKAAAAVMSTPVEEEEEERVHELT
ncbi:CRIB domain-containing protein RIC5 [Linum grandiflorum]